MTKSEGMKQGNGGSDVDVMPKISMEELPPKKSKEIQNVS
jgi:hypothetical protein